jgi:hypothetical protein
MTERRARSAGPEERAHHAGDDGAALAGSDWRNRQRMSAKRKQSALLRLLRGENLELISRELGVTATELSASGTPSWPRVKPRLRPGRRMAGTSRSGGSRPKTAS